MPIQFVSSEMAGAPVLTGVSGSLAALLKTCLVTGFNLVTLDSLVVAANVATATRAAGLSYPVGSKATIAGAAPGALNGVQEVLSASSTSFTFAAPGVADQTATGTITAKVSPLGWDNPFGATNIEVFRSPNGDGPRHYVRVDDGGAEARAARVKAYLTMTDVDTGVDQYPTEVAMPGGAYWVKSASAGGTVRPWVVAGDDRTFYLMIGHSRSAPSALGYGCVGFGDFDSFVPADVYGCALHGHWQSAVISAVSGTEATNSDLDAHENVHYNWQVGAPAQSGSWGARGYSGVGVGAVLRKGITGLLRSNPTTSASLVRSGQSLAAFVPYPNGADNGAYLSKSIFIDGSVIRGAPRGMYFINQAVGPSVFTQGEAIVGISGLPGRTLRVVNSGIGAFAVDCTGPW